MKLRLLILLAAALAAAPAAGQTIKSLGYNTTNGNVVAATNVTFTNSVGFSTNARAATRTNLGATTVGDSVFTATNAAAAATAIGLGTTNDVQFNKALSQSSVIGGGADAFLHIVTPRQGEIQIGWGSEDFEMDELALTLEQTDWKFYKPFSVPNATNRAIIRANLELGATNNVTFSNITANGTLGVSNAATFATNVTVNGNATLNGVGNIAPQQTADSGAHLMTRDLTDTRMVDYIMHAPNRFRNLSHAMASHISGTGTAVHAGPITEGRINVRIVNGSTNSFASVKVNRQGPWNGTEGVFGIDWSRPMSLAVMGSKNQITNNVTRAFLVLGAGGGDNDLPTNGHWVALNWVTPTNAEVLVSKAGVVTTNAATITTSASPTGFGLWIDHKTNGTGDIYYAERNSATSAALQKPTNATVTYSDGPMVTSTNQTSLTFGLVGLSTNTGASFEIVGLNNAVFFAP